MDKMKVGIVATDGFMGKLLEEIVTEREGMEPVTLEDDFDVIIDFTHPDNLNMIIDKAPIAIRLAKDVTNNGYDTDLKSGSAYEVNAFGVLFGSEDMREGTKAFLEKRSPQWKNK